MRRSKYEIESADVDGLATIVVLLFGVCFGLWFWYMIASSDRHFEESRALGMQCLAAGGKTTFHVNGRFVDAWCDGVRMNK